MNTANIASKRPSLYRTALIALGCAFLVALVSTPTLNATEATATALPLTATFAKVAGDNGPHTLKLTNTSKTDLKVSVKILLSVYSHASDKAKVLPAETIAAGKDWTITKLAALDKVIITAEGHAPLTLEVR